jgi:hypothetical protein
MSDIADPPGTTYVVPVSVNRLAEHWAPGLGVAMTLPATVERVASW